MTVERNVKGLLGTKLGMTQMWDDNNRIVPVTVVAASTNVVTQVRKPETDGYNAIQVGFGEIDSPQGHQARGRPVREGRGHPAPPRGRDPHRGRRRPTPSARSSRPTPSPPATIIDVTGTTKGKGFAGTMKRHGFHGVGASHGAHRNHRKPGSIGACATPGRVFKGVRMSGRMGRDTVTTQNVVVHAVDAEKGLILLKGAVPGPKGGLHRPPLGRQERAEGGLTMATTTKKAASSPAASAPRSSRSTSPPRSSTPRSTSR